MSTHREWETFLCRFLQILSTTATIQGERCLSPKFFALLTCWHVQFLPFSFLHKLTSIYRQNWSCEKIPKSQSSVKATSFSYVVVNIASSVQKGSYSKPLHNKSRCLNTMKSFLVFKVISTWIFVYFQKGFTMKLWQNTQFTTANFVLLYIHRAIPRARMGYWLRGHEGERNNCFSKIQLAVENIETKQL